MKDNINTAENMLKCEMVSHRLDENVAYHADNTLLSSRKCVVVGGTSLAVFCAEQIQSAGHIIQAVLPTDSILQSWAEQKGIDWVNSVDELQEHMLLQPIDWLFSISNPIILPELLIQQIHGGAFNYHDSPLPYYAGTYATFWALLARETSYAISWHCIDGSVNAGNIAVQWPVSIEEEDTAFLLNLKCYQAAQKGFNKLLKDLSQGTLATYPQDLSKRSFYALSRQPSAGGYLCWEQPCEILSALVRALNFGENYVHPFGYPKLLLKQDTVRISWLQRLDICSGEKPGTLIHVDENSWQVTTGSEDVRIGGFFTLEGQSLSAKALAELSELKSGEQLPLLSPQQAQNVKNTLQKRAPDEPFWYKRLTDLQPTHLPFDIPHKTEEPRWATSPWQSAFPQNSQETIWRTLLQAFIIYLTRLTQQTVCQVGWWVETNDELSHMASVVPMTIEATFDKPWREIAAAVDNELTLLAQYGTYSRDLFSRFPAPRTTSALRTRFLWPIAVSVVQDNKQYDQERFGELLTFQINTQGSFRWVYDGNRLSSEVILRMSEHLQMLLSSNRKNDEVPVEQLNLLPESERTLLLETWNMTDTAYPENLCIHQLFEQQVAETPAATALVYKNQTLSYAELNARTNRLAHQLIDLGVVPDQLVAICVSRSLAMVIGLLAILKAGGAYVPLDPDYPRERLAHILMDAAPPIVLADETGQTALGETILAERKVFNPNTVFEQSESNPQIATLTSQNLAYVIYTSGSTGTPKGVMNEHRGVVNRLLWAQEEYQLTEHDRVLQKTPFSFDVSVWEFFLPLLAGAQLIISRPGGHKDPAYLLSEIESQGITTLHFVPSMLQSFLHYTPVDRCQTLRRILCSGEALSYALKQQCMAHFPHSELHNLYGPTEAAIDVTAWHCRADKYPGRVPIGRPISNTHIYILNKYHQPLPMGVAGELYIGGVAVARGYLNRPELTVGSFLADPFSDKPHARMYRTGDLARYLPDGNLEYLGRNDQQVKIRGFRIEPGEIEAQLAEHPSVRGSVVMTQGESSDKRLVAYVVADAEEGLVNHLRTHLSAALPDHMVPVAFIRLDAFPLTPNGKLDSKALPVPGEDAFARQMYDAPQGEIETILVAVWRELLGIEKISRHDNFLALGGHSLLAVRVINRIMAVLGVELPLVVLFNSLSLAALAQEVQTRRNKQDSTALPIISPAPRTERLSLSFAQQRLWFLTQLEGVSETYHIPLALHLHGQLDINAWQQALNAVFARHEALRTVFVSVDGQPQIRLLAKDSGLPLVQHDLRGYPEANTAREQIVTEAVSAPFDLSREPLIRARLIRLTEEDTQFLLTQHHIVSDGWSVTVLIRELNVFYTAFLSGHQYPLSPLAIQYPDYAAWQHQWFSAERTQVQSNYWRTVLADAPVLLDLPTDRPRPPKQSFAGQAVSVHLEPALTAALRQLSQQHGVTLFMTVLSAWAIVLSRLSGQEDIIIGTPSAGRSWQEVEPLIGFFVNTLALRMAVSGELTVEECLTQVRETALAAQTHQDLPFEQVVEIVQPPRNLAHTPLFQVMFTWQNNEHIDWNLPGLTVTPITQSVDAVKFDLELELYEEADGISGALNYSTALFDQSTIERHSGYLQAVLQAMVANVQQKVGSIDILAPAERQLLLETWNATATAYPEDLCIHQLFEQQVAKTPTATALVYKNQVFSYAELNARTNRLAHQLIDLGVAPDQLVAICMSRTPAMVVGVLAILKAGGAYMPLDPVYPGERLTHMLTDAAPMIILMDKTGQSALGTKALEGITIIDPNTLFDQSDSNPQIVTLTSRHLAYVIYTSGSTGTPKGVMVEHRGVCNYLLWAWDYYRTKQSLDSLVSSSLAFDATVTSLYLPLICGGKIHLLHDGEEKTELLPALLSLESGSLVKITPEHLLVVGQELKATEKQCLAHCFVVGGEALPRSTIELWRILSKGSRFINEYGPTETVVGCTVFDTEYLNHSVGNVPIGYPIANTRIYLLDAHGKSVPIGSVGELYIGGIGVARGYLKQDKLTKERFLFDPFSDKPDPHMYRTGDLARYLPDGNLEYLGRNDQQVKIRGFRIEPGEIEARLTEHAAVKEAVVLALGEGQDKRLVVYMVADDQPELVSHLRTHLSGVLPEYMIPAAFVHLDSFPLTPNGKLDRKALPVPDSKAFARQRYEAPQGEIETALVAIWRELLGIEQISRHDNFFALGGHSLIAVRVMNRIMAVLGVELPLTELFNSPSLMVLAQAVQYRLAKQDSPVLPALIPVCREGRLPLSFAQQRLWFLAQFEGIFENVSEAYHIPLSLHFHGRLEIAAWQQALNTIFARHEALRTVFISVEGQPQVRLLAAEHGLPLVYHDLRECPDAETALECLCAEEISAPFDLSEGPLIRAVLIQLTEENYQFVLTQHHIVSDGWSITVLIRELNVLYTAFLTGQPDPFPPLTIQYPDYAAWQHQWLSAEYTQVQSDYWCTTLADAPVLLGLPTDRPRPPKQSFAGQAVSVRLDPALTAGLKHLSQQHGVTLFMTVLSAWAIVLSRLSGQEDIIIGTPSAGRSRQEVEPLIGFFVNMLALRMVIPSELTVAECLTQVRETALAAQVHQDLPFEQVVGVVQPPRRLAHTPLFQVMFIWQNNEHADWNLPGLTVRPITQTVDAVKFDLELELYEEADGISGALNYSTALFDQPTIERHSGYLQAVLQAMVGNAQQKVGEIVLLH